MSGRFYQKRQPSEHHGAEKFFRQAAYLNVVPAQPGKLLDEHRRNITVLNDLDHFLKAWTAHGRACDPVVPLSAEGNKRREAIFYLTVSERTLLYSHSLVYAPENLRYLS